MNHDVYLKLEFTNIREMLAEHALCQTVKERCLNLAPDLSETACRRRMDETTRARNILDVSGNPPLAVMQDVEKILTLCASGAMLTPEQISAIEQFLTTCRRMQHYLKRAESSDEIIASYAASFQLLPELTDEISRCIRNGGVDSGASAELSSVRRKLDQMGGQIQSKLASLVQSHRQWLSDSGVVQRGGRYVLPVKREYKSKVSGSVVDMSGTGSTVFIEPASVARLSQQIQDLQIEEENEVRKVLYTLSALIDDYSYAIRIDIEAMETLDFLFAKAKLSAALGAGPVELTAERRIDLIKARHPLLQRDAAVPLDLAMDADTHGVIITGPNTGGKTVSLKTVGLLCLMAQSGLHVTADPNSTVCLFGDYLCDLGDGQSISQNLSTFSSHMTTVIDILDRADKESLVLLDELGSGTDPAEGMGIAVAVLEALRVSGCMLVATTHYPEVKAYAQQAEGFINARMAFDRDTMQPTYRLEVGHAGESCALFIAQRLGLHEDILKAAEEIAYRDGGRQKESASFIELLNTRPEKKNESPKSGRIQRTEIAKPSNDRAQQFEFGDGVSISPDGEHGIVYQIANSRGEVGVQVKGRKRLVPYKRLTIVTKAEMLYPPDYDFSVVFDTVENRKARKLMDKGHHIEGNVIYYDKQEK